MGSRSHPHRVLSVCMCVCVSRCLWVCVIEADSLQLRVITVGLYQFLSRSLSCQILAVFAVDVYGPFWFLVPRFLSPAAFLDSISWALLLSWTPIAGDSSAHCFPALPASAFEELHFSFSHCITSCNKLSFPQLNPPIFIVTSNACKRAELDLFWRSCSSYFKGVKHKIVSHGSLMRKSCNVTEFCPWSKYTAYMVPPYSLKMLL